MSEIQEVLVGLLRPHIRAVVGLVPISVNMRGLQSVSGGVWRLKMIHKGPSITPLRSKKKAKSFFQMQSDSLWGSAVRNWPLLLFFSLVVYGIFSGSLTDSVIGLGVLFLFVWLIRGER